MVRMAWRLYFLIQEKSGFLSVDVVHLIAHAVLNDLCDAVGVGFQSFAAVEVLEFSHSFQGADCDVVPFI